jgi:hypothetical protein
VSVDLSDHEIEQRRATMTSKLEALGDVTTSDTPGARGRRPIELNADAPGADMPRLASFRYREVFERSGERWQLIAYAYEYLDRVRGGRRAYHWHDDLIHAHCVDPEAGRTGGHYRAVPLDVFEAHDEFARIYLAGGTVRCDDLRPLLV